MRKNILIVEDDPGILYMLGHVLQKGFNVLKASSGEEALELINQNVDLAIIDFELPGIQGTELSLRIRSLYPNTKIIMMSGHPSIEGTAMACDIDLFLQKPLPENIGIVVKNIFSDRFGGGKQLEKVCN